MHSSSINCPQCGDEQELAFKHTKLTVCPSCGSTLFIEDEHVRLAGKQSVIADYPSLIQLNHNFKYQQDSYLPVGHIRYNYRLGYWDEWWVVNNSGQGKWLSVDEGDFVLEKPISIQSGIPNLALLSLNQEYTILNQAWIVTELDRATCVGFRGELPEIINVGESYDFAHLSGMNGELLTLEFPEDQAVRSYIGKWLDPYLIKVDE